MDARTVHCQPRPGRVAFALLLAVALPASAQLRLETYVSGLNAPLELVQDPSTPSIQYVVEQGGRIRVIQGGALLAAPFLDLSAVISSGGERGLLGLAFAPDYAQSRRFFVNFTDPNGNTVVARFLRSAGNPALADATTRFDLRWGGGEQVIPQPFANHNGGHLAFGPDGYLYVAVGDGGSSDDPHNNAQNPATLLGKLLRIDVSVPDTDPNGYVVPADNPFVDNVPVAALHEIWAFGLRNPWKFTFDDPALGGTGAMLIGDVGQGAFEEVDYQPPGAGGRNYGWRTREGAHAYITSPGPLYLPVIDPIAEYDHAAGRSITGGFVYRGTALGSGYRGRYFYADFITGRVWSIALNPAAGGEVIASTPVEHTSELGGTSAIGNVSAFGVDAAGELYVVSYSAGRILKLVVTPPDLPDEDTGVFDFDGDDRTDFVVWNPTSGIWFQVNSSNGAVLNQQWGAGLAPYNDVPAPADYDGDGRTDFAVWRASTGVWWVIRSSDGNIFSATWGSTGDLPVPGDYDADGRTDFAVWHPLTGVWDVLLSATGGTLSRQWGAGFDPYNDIPVPADYDGDGRTDFAVWRSSTGHWYIVRSSDGTTTGQPWGLGTAPYNDIPVPGDYDGDGKTDIAIWRPVEGGWWVMRSSDGGVLFRQWGAGFAPYNDVPVPADYDGDGRTDIAVWRAWTAEWYVIRSSDGAIVSRQWGTSSDVPIPGSP